MVTIEYTIRKLKEQVSKVNQGDLEVWLNTTYAFIEDYFISYSTRARTFSGLISDYQIKKIGDDYGISKIDTLYYKSKGLEYISECLQYLQEENERIESERKEKERLENERLKRESEQQKTETKKSISMAKKLDKFDEHFNKGTGTKPTIIKPEKETQLPFGIPGALFWTIFAGVVWFSYFLGNENGKSKFDKEKSDYYNENIRLKNSSDSLLKVNEKLKMY